MNPSLKVNKINSANANAQATIALSELDKKIDQVTKAAGKNLKIDGFRKGKIPAAVIKSRYGKQLETDAQRECVQDLLQEILKELNIKPNALIGDPRITKFEKKENGIELEIELSLAPDIPLNDVESCIPEVKIPEVTEEEINQRLEEIADARAPLVGIEDARRKLKDGEYAKIDFEGFIDGKPFEGGKAENYLLKIGSKSFIEGFEDQLIGMKKDEEREIQVTFPENYHAANLAGKPATFKVKLNEIQTKGKIEIDDNFAKTLLPEEKEANVALLKEKIKDQIAAEKKQALYNNELKAVLIENLHKAIDFDLPNLIVEQEMDLLLKNEFAKLPKEEQEKLAKDTEALKAKREEQRDAAQKSVKSTFIIDAIAKRDNIDINENEILNTIYYEAMAMRQDPKMVLEYYKNNNLIPAIKMAMLEDRILTNLLNKNAK
ncbi:trigger factor [Helicobacter canadensis]|uniref:Trigger factor n=1 Tax=Helicobacter canadensis MIT 98-5491 TaxID=537970 RepID=C5ZVT9_9HELI|nr:trigger factor [Helicobacter canadensis]EES89020.1 trigger factor [Helicobacter canadensis MIT 98-5491]EFR49387.1 trigger factor [Helicobacter canadensis MIT 98-5491]STO99049.1 peptidyl-prolyl cis /trans isomerase [Helicobacter canadensis]